jgi:hypothetical protein
MLYLVSPLLISKEVNLSPVKTEIMLIQLLFKLRVHDINSILKASAKVHNLFYEFDIQFFSCGNDSPCVLNRYARQYTRIKSPIWTERYISFGCCYNPRQSDSPSAGIVGNIRNVAIPSLNLSCLVTLISLWLKYTLRGEDFIITEL